MAADIPPAAEACAEGGYVSDAPLERNVTQRERLEAELAHRATHDLLTGLPNRAVLLDRIDEEIEQSPGTVGVLFIDLDNFTMINDGYGHAAGDMVLAEVARRLRAAVRPADTVARLAGDEFVVAARHLGPVDARRLSERLRASLTQPVQIGGTQLLVSSSVGIALDPAPGSSADGLLRDAGIAMFVAKARGRSRCVLFDDTMRLRARARGGLVNDLRGALGRGEIRVEYQPIVDLDTSETVAVEALARWTHPQHGPISPAEFIPLAEETGLIGEIGKFVLEQATAAVAAWPGPELTCGINLSARQITEPGIVSQITDALTAAGLPAGRLAVEITETAVLDDVAAASTALRRLRDLGVKISLDDFGTGYSSLENLTQLPVDCLKVDRSFVSDPATAPDGLKIAAVVIDLARVLGLDTVAEGIETEEQRQQLRAFGCRHGQGFLFGRPQANRPA